MYPGPQGQGPPNSQMYGNQGQGPPHPGMFYGGPSQGVYNDYNGSNGQPYGQPQQQEYYPPQQQGQMYDQQTHGHGPPNAGMGGGQMMQSMQSGRDEPTKILRNPFPTTSVNSSQSKNDIYDPSVPTSQRMAPPPPIISSGIPPSSGASSMASMSSHQTSAHGQGHGPMFTGGNGPTYGLPENSNMPMQMGNTGMYNSNANYGNNNMAPPQQAAPTPGPDPSAYQSYANMTPAPYGNSSVQQEPQSTLKMQVMTGVVTQIQPGAFGMVSGEIFYQEK